tara:strand:+ start:7365 stop:7922 length:558 start_codon:yes stop_codon:yes gene_type:complete
MEIDMRKILMILTLSASMLAYSGTALADRDSDKATANKSYDNHRQQADRKHHADKGYSHKREYKREYKREHKKEQHKKYRRETHRQQKLATKHRDRIATYQHFNGNNYNQWRERRFYSGHPLEQRYRAYKQHNQAYYSPNHDRYRSHYLRYHRGHKRSHHQHDDNYLEWVTTMLLLNELLDDDYR